ncbi:hypothetical protein DFQ27_004214 [Actinomortierella ambigua]|uniref:Uncharacterized protein n=1 Tax=Actinomortierella ambigua TaxID=1343610 RepID=A0A9P6Q2F0_9FUNG|nr:hypothetical protein DFQ27_004214 [Actinomortierella ambigua]
MTQYQPIRKVLIANRGEIACRVIRTCRKLGIATVAVYSESDANALFVRMADESVFIGPSPSSESYLRGEKIIDACRVTGADAVHPGYGFLSENTDFAKACTEAGINFIGPQPESILAIGDKIASKNLLAAKEPSIPLIPGYNGAKQDIETLIQEAIRIEFPVLLKASAGGGGKGMRIVHEASALRDEIEMAKSEAMRSFGSDALLIEKYIATARHIEIQIMGDKHGHVYHCFERECSIQRRHQKVIEETPSPMMDEQLRREMTTAAIKIGKLLRYEGAGTVEFIVDDSTRQFYFLEMNTRLQVEHPVTEMVTGLDLVELQILVAQGFDLSQTELPNLKLNGSSIECRLYAEDPENDFLPCTGKIRRWKQCEAEHVRYDSGIDTGSEISIYYDPMISKISVWAPTRAQAIAKMSLAMRETVALGLTTNRKFLIQVLNHPRFQSGRLSTRFIDEEAIHKQASLTPPHPDEDRLAIVPLLWLWHLRDQARQEFKHVPSGWRYVKHKKQQDGFTSSEVADRLVELQYALQTRPNQWTPPGQRPADKKFEVLYRATSSSEPGKVLAPYQEKEWRTAQVGLGRVQVEQDELTGEMSGVLRCTIDGVTRDYNIANGSVEKNQTEVYVHTKDFGGKQILYVRRDKLKSAAASEEDTFSPYTAPMPCKILKVLVPSGQQVKKNQALLTMESMKTEVRLYARHDGLLTLHVGEGDLIEAGVTLCEIK